MNTQMKTEIINNVVLQQEVYCAECNANELCDKCFEREHPEEWEEHLQLERAMQDAREGDEENGVRYGADLEEEEEREDTQSEIDFKEYEQRLEEEREKGLMGREDQFPLFECGQCLQKIRQWEGKYKRKPICFKCMDYLADLWYGCADCSLPLYDMLTCYKPNTFCVCIR